MPIKTIMKRAWSTLEIKSTTEATTANGKRTFKGVASTITPDMSGDVMEPDGAEYRLPIPFLWQHDSKQPIGWITKVTKTANQILVEGEVAVIAVAGKLKDRVDEAWDSLKAGLVRGLSIGFVGLDFEMIKGSFGLHYLKWAWVELSAVTIPMNMEANLQSIKSVDTPVLRASLGDTQDKGVVVRLDSSSGVSGNQRQTTRSAKMAKKTVQEQIASFEATRATKAARMGEIMDAAADTGTTLDEAQQEEYDTLDTELKAIDAHIVRLKAHEAIMVKAAAATPPGDGRSPGSDGVQVRQGAVITTQNNVEKGTGFTRYAIALARSKGNLMQALEISKQWHDTTPQVEASLKAAVASGDTVTANWAVELADYTFMASEFIELLRPATILGKIQGLRRVPFMIRMPATASGTSAHWVGQGAGKPLSKMDFDTVTLAQNKIATIVVLTEELVRFSSPSAEAVVRQDMIDAIAQFTDQQFIDPTVAVSGTVSPASITNGATSRSITGNTVAAIMNDIGALMGGFITSNITLKAGVWIMHPRTALFLSMLRTAQDVFAFPGITMNGGTFYGMPVVTSANVPIDTGNDTYIVLMDASEVFLADDGGVTLDVSREASLQMIDTSSAKDTAASQVSLWQNNLVGLRAERFITWKRRRAAAVQVIEDVSY